MGAPHSGLSDTEARCRAFLFAHQRMTRILEGPRCCYLDGTYCYGGHNLFKRSQWNSANDG